MTTVQIGRWGASKLSQYHPFISWYASMTIAQANRILRKEFSHYRIHDYDGLAIYNNTERGA